MSRSKSLLLLLLAVFANQVHATLRRAKNGLKNEVKRNLERADKSSLFKDDAGFWSRFVQEVSSSIPPETTPSPTPPPSIPESCSGEVSFLCIEILIALRIEKKALTRYVNVLLMVNRLVLRVLTRMELHALNSSVLRVPALWEKALIPLGSGWSFAPATRAKTRKAGLALMKEHYQLQASLFV